MPKSIRVPLVRDKQHLYECSVQSVDADLDFAERVYRKRHGEAFRRLREDFCGTAALACHWILRRPENRAVGVDLDPATLDWGIEHNVEALGEERRRLLLIRGDVREIKQPRVQVTMALNFSYWIFKRRADMARYLRAARAGLEPGGMLILDLFGGTEAMVKSEEVRSIGSSIAFDGTRVPAFKYVWEQHAFNPITNDFVCHIHFRLKDGTRLNRAFSYDWRFWTLPELRELLDESGFASSEVYTDDWDEDEEDSNGIYRRRKWFDHEGVWVGYLVAYR